MQPKISVLMPVYNAERFLAEAVESILKQTFTEFEFIIIDDGSTDNSINILKNYSSLDPRIKLITRENRGLIKTLNEGVDLARAKYIARMDADDISLPLRFEKQIEFLDEHPEHIAVGTLAELIDIDGDLIGSFGGLKTHEEIDGAHIKGIGGAIVHPSAMIRRTAMVKVGGYLECYQNAEDLDLWLRLAEHGKLANIPSRLLLYRQHMDSIGYKMRLSQIESARKAVMSAYKRRNFQFKKSLLSERAAIVPTKGEIYTKWGWWALKNRNIKVAKKYAYKAMIKSPYKLSSWKLLYCSLRGY